MNVLQGSDYVHTLPVPSHQRQWKTPSNKRATGNKPDKNGQLNIVREKVSGYNMSCSSVQIQCPPTAVRRPINGRLLAVRRSRSPGAVEMNVLPPSTAVPMPHSRLLGLLCYRNTRPAYTMSPTQLTILSVSGTPDLHTQCHQHSSQYCQSVKQRHQSNIPTLNTSTRNPNVSFKFARNVSRLPILNNSPLKPSINLMRNLCN